MKCISMKRLVYSIGYPAQIIFRNFCGTWFTILTILARFSEVPLSYDVTHWFFRKFRGLLCGDAENSAKPDLLLELKTWEFRRAMTSCIDLFGSSADFWVETRRESSFETSAELDTVWRFCGAWFSIKIHIAHVSRNFRGALTSPATISEVSRSYLNTNHRWPTGVSRNSSAELPKLCLNEYYLYYPL